MNILLLANNWVGFQIAAYLNRQKETIVGLGIHETKRQAYTKEILKVANLSPDRIFLANTLRQPKTIATIKELAPDIIICAFWGYILKPELIAIPKRGVINLHPGYLPFNRGVMPNVWPFLDGTPAGVTIHFIDQGIDTGAIIARRKVTLTPYDTADSLYQKTLTEIVSLFKKTWPKIRQGTHTRTPQNKLGRTTTHRWSEAEPLDKIDKDKIVKVEDFINFLRARSYENRFFAYYESRGKRVYIRLQLSKTAT